LVFAFAIADSLTARTARWRPADRSCPCSSVLVRVHPC
jgi:hypothetical protein